MFKQQVPCCCAVLFSSKPVAKHAVNAVVNAGGSHSARRQAPTGVCLAEACVPHM
jgi:hypothetical protein